MLLYVADGRLYGRTVSYELFLLLHNHLLAVVDIESL